MSYIITGVVCLLVGFVAGLLVYRKHSAKAKAIESAVKAETLCAETPATTVKATILTWLSKAFSEPDGSPSSRRILFAIAVAYALGLATAALSFTRTLTPEIVSVTETCIWATAASLGIGKFAEGRRP